MIRSRRLVLIAVVPAVMLALTVAVRAVTADRTLTFVDDSRGLVLTMQTEPAARDAGRFAFRVAGLGVYEGSSGTAMRALTSTSVVVNYNGPAALRPITDVNGRVTGSVSAPSAATISFQAQIDPAHLTAEATLTDQASRFHLVVAARARGDFLRAVAAFESAVAADDTAAIYATMNSDVRSANSPASFDQLWRAQEAQTGRITKLDRTALSDITTDAAGTTSAIASYSATLAAPSGSVTTRSYDAYFILQADGWKLWYTTAR